MKHTRFSLTGALISGLFIGAGCTARPAISDAPAAPVINQNMPQLKDVYQTDFAIGTTLGNWAQDGAPAKLALAHAQFNAFTPENLLKPALTQRKQGVFTFDDADKFVAEASKNGAIVVGHTLVWHSQSPDWMWQDANGQPLPRAQGLENMRAHIGAVVGRYKGRIAQWDVVNEAVSDKKGELLRPTPWLKSVGDDYIAQAFRAAHAADPTAILIYNDYGNERPDKRAKTVELLKALLADKVPVHAVGMQLHTRLGADIGEIEESIRQYGALGLKVMITELDMTVLPAPDWSADIAVRFDLTPASNPYTAGLPADIERRQAKQYGELFAMFARNADVIDRVTLWGISDDKTWKNNHPIKGRTDYPLLFDGKLQPKPAFDAVVEAAKG